MKRRRLGFREPVSQAEEGADFPAFIPGLVYLGEALIREAERVFVSSNVGDHRVGCFHQDVFPFWLFIRTLFEPKECQLCDKSCAFRCRPHAGTAILFTEGTHFRKVAA